MVPRQCFARRSHCARAPPRSRPKLPPHRAGRPARTTPHISVEHPSSLRATLACTRVCESWNTLCSSAMPPPTRASLPWMLTLPTVMSNADSAHRPCSFGESSGSVHWKLGISSGSAYPSCFARAVAGHHHACVHTETQRDTQRDAERHTETHRDTHQFSRCTWDNMATARSVPDMVRLWPGQALCFGLGAALSESLRRARVSGPEGPRLGGV
eukprot:1970096-Rhodomonas_salina.1